jgi:hypothetical protein
MKIRQDQNETHETHETHKTHEYLTKQDRQEVLIDTAKLLE